MRWTLFVPQDRGSNRNKGMLILVATPLRMALGLAPHDFPIQ
jgi:hypothetical protein